MTGKAILDKIIIGINLLGLLLGIGIFVYKNKIYQRPYPDEFLEYKKMQEALKGKTEEKSYKFDKIIVNLKSVETRLRFLSFQMEVVVFKEPELKIIEEAKPLIYDSVIETINYFDPDEINTVTGKILFENKLKREINNIAKKAIVKRIYFTSFVIQ